MPESRDALSDDEIAALSPGHAQFVEELSAKIAAVLVDRGFEAAVAKDVAEDCADYVRATWGGQQIYIQLFSAIDRARRDREIAAMWNGRNTREVCMKYKISATQIRRIGTAARRSSKNGNDDESGSP